MKTLIVYTHPNHESLNGAFLEAVKRGIYSNPTQQEVEVLDLYKEEFDPVLIFNKENKRRDMDKDPTLEKYREQLRWANRLVFLYPIFWGRPPAMLLGYIDRLFATNFAYRSLPNKIRPEGLLKDKSVVCISTMKGPANYILLILNNAHKVLMKKAVFNFVGIKKVKFFEFGSMESPKGKQTQKLNKIEEYFSK